MRSLLRILVFALAAIAPAAAQAAGDAPRTIRVVLDHAYAPYSFRSAEGELQGILVDQWRAWEAKTGVKVEMQGMDWPEAMRRMRAGEFDVIDSIFQTAERGTYLDFTPAFTTVDASIFFRKDVSGIADLASLRGFPVGVKAGDQHIHRLANGGVTTVVPFPSDDQVVEAAGRHKINIFVLDVPSALYHLNQKGLADDFRYSAAIFRDELRRGVRKGDALLRTVSDGFASIDREELRRIDEKWFGAPVHGHLHYGVYAAYTLVVAVLLITALMGWNRTLKRGILQRTAALGESEQRLRQITENIREVFWVASPGLDEILYVSPAYESVWGRSVAGLYQRPQSFFESIHPQDRERASAAIRENWDRGFDIEYRVLRPDGTVRAIRDRGFPVKDPSGRVYRVAGISEDITAQKDAEDNRRLVIDTIPAMAWIVLPDGRLEFLNRRWLEYTVMSLEEGIENANRAVHPDDLELIDRRWREDMVVGKPFEYELRMRRADGEYRWFLVRTVPLYGEQGNILKWYGTSTDIEDRVRAEHALRELSRRLVELQEAERKALARELHDRVGQSLTALKLNVEMLQLALASQGDSEAVMRLEDSAGLLDSMMDTIDNVMSELRPPMLDDYGLASALDWHARIFSKRTGIAVAVLADELEARPAPQIEIALFRIAQEALNNVAKHAGARHADITFEDGDGEWVMSVQDDGIGFDPLDSVSIGSNPRLGIVTMRERAQAIGGQFEVRTSSDGGTRLTVRVPW